MCEQQMSKQQMIEEQMSEQQMSEEQRRKEQLKRDLQPYVDYLLSNVCIKEAAIWVIDAPGDLLVASKGLQSIAACEIKKLLGNRKELELNSLVIVNWKCVLLKDDLDTDDDHMMNLKTWADSEGKRYPVSIGKTKRAFIIVIGTDGAQAGQVANTLFNILSHLRNANW